MSNHNALCPLVNHFLPYFSLINHIDHNKNAAIPVLNYNSATTAKPFFFLNLIFSHTETVNIEPLADVLIKPLIIKPQ